MEASNVKAMREALVKVKHTIDAIGKASIGIEHTCAGLLSIIDVALAAPPRNCDVGTPEEQIRRFEEFCQYRFIKSNCSECPLNDNNEDPSCFDLWLQMPYNEGGAK